MTAQPWMKFFPTDWRSDPRLRMCGLSARGLWMEMIMLMHEATPYGHLTISGIAPTDAQLAVLVGTTPDQIPALIQELETAGVFSRNAKGVIYSRRMARDEKKARTARKNGVRGGNPTLCKQKENSASDNPQDKAEDNTQKPEARSQEEKKDTVADATGACGTVISFPKPAEPLSLKSQIWTLGLDYLRPIAGTTDAKLRSRLGGWCKQYGDVAVVDAIAHTQTQGAVDPLTRIESILRGKSNGRNHPPGKQQGSAAFQAATRYHAGSRGPELDLNSDFG